MELDYLNALPLGGFNFDNAIRNKAMAESGILQVPKTMKTGTTICGVLIKVRLNTHTHIHQLELITSDNSLLPCKM